MAERWAFSSEIATRNKTKSLIKGREKEHWLPSCCADAPRRKGGVGGNVIGDATHRKGERSRREEVREFELHEKL